MSMVNNWENMWICTKYIPHWDDKDIIAWTGVRETYQNFADGIEEFLSKKYKKLIEFEKLELKREMKTCTVVPNTITGDDTATVLTGKKVSYYNFTYYYDGEIVGTIEYSPIYLELTFSNPGVVPLQAIALGGTGKDKDDGNSRGRFGEGLKLNALVLLRAKKRFFMLSGEHRWDFCLMEERKTKLSCLNFNITKKKDTVRVKKDWTYATIGEVTAEEVVQCFRRIVPLTDLEKGIIKSGESNNPNVLLMGKDLIGKTFVNGIFVCVEKGTEKFGYDMKDIKLNRDRTSIPDVWDRYNKTSTLHAQVANNYGKLCVGDGAPYLQNYFTVLFNMTLRGIRWVYNLNPYLSPVSRNRIFQQFQLYVKEKFGKEDVMPVYGSYMGHTFSECYVREKLRVNGLKESFYRFHQCGSSYLWPILYSSKMFESVDARIKKLWEKEEYKPSVEETKIVKEVVTELQQIDKNFKEDQIKFKNFPFGSKVKKGNTVFLSKEVFDSSKTVEESKKFTTNKVKKLLFKVVFESFFTLEQIVETYIK